MFTLNLCIKWAAPTSKQKASGALFDAGGFDDDPPPPSNGIPAANTSFIQSSLKNRGMVAGIETKNSHLLFLDGPPQWQTDAGLCAHRFIPLVPPIFHMILLHPNYWPDAPACNTCVVPFDFFIRRHHVRVITSLF
jgi:hypothetical protein